MNITPEMMCEFIANAESGLPAILPPVEGYSSPKVRRLLTQLNGIAERYLEIGVHVGSTFIPACMDHPNLTATAIDNWSLFGNARPQFELNIQTFLTCQTKIIEGDCFQVPLSEIQSPIDVYFYDGSHDFQSQYLALKRFAPLLADRCVYVADDCNWAEPRDGTIKALREIDFDVIWNCLLPARYERDVHEWWNGLLVMILERRK